MFHLLDVVKTLHTNVVRYLITQRVNGSQLHTSQQEHRAILAHDRLRRPRATFGGAVVAVANR